MSPFSQGDPSNAWERVFLISFLLSRFFFPEPVFFQTIRSPGPKGDLSTIVILGKNRGQRVPSWRKTSFLSGVRFLVFNHFIKMVISTTNEPNVSRLKGLTKVIVTLNKIVRSTMLEVLLESDKRYREIWTLIKVDA